MTSLYEDPDFAMEDLSPAGVCNPLCPITCGSCEPAHEQNDIEQWMYQK